MHRSSVFSLYVFAVLSPLECLYIDASFPLTARKGTTVLRTKHTATTMISARTLSRTAASVVRSHSISVDGVSLKMCDVSSFILAAKTGSHTAPSSDWRWAHTSTAYTVLSTDLLRLFLILVRYFHRQSTNPASVALAARRSYATAKPGECSCSPTELPCWLSAVLSRWLAHFAARFLALGDFRSLSACPQRSDHDPGSHSAGTARRQHSILTYSARAYTAG